MKKGGVDMEKAKEEKAKASGVFYRMMMEHVLKVLADPKRVCSGRKQVTACSGLMKSTGK